MRLMALREWGLEPVLVRALALALAIRIRLLRVLGGLFVGGADGFAPGIGVVGVDVFVLGEGQDLY